MPPDEILNIIINIVKNISSKLIQKVLACLALRRCNVDAQNVPKN
jgi:hypothetical protein